MKLRCCPVSVRSLVAGSSGIGLAVALAAIASAAPPPSDGANVDDRPLLPAIEKQQRLAEQAIRAEVVEQLRDARTRLADHPADVQRDLALLAGRVFRLSGLSESTRAELRGQIAPVVREARRRALAPQDGDANANQRAAERQRIDQADRDQQRVKQAADRFGGLIERGQYAEAEKLGEQDLRLIGPGAEVGASAPLVADAIESERRAKDLSDRRTEGTGNFYAAEERAAIPFADDRPIEYPQAGAWRELTARRRESFGPHGKKFTPAEQEIRKQLQTETDLDFENTQLRDVATYLKDLHGIEVQLDYKGLDWVGITGETPVTRKVKGIRLRSALRLILGDLDLTYLIADEVLLITTPERARNAIETRIYPVEDLVTPKTPLPPPLPFGFF